MFDKLTVMSMATTAMDWIAQRQKVLSENIANVDTPGYTPKDLKPLDFKSVLKDTAAPTVLPVTTDPRHIVPSFTDPNTVLTQKKSYETSPDGNGVVLEEQMAKVGDGNASYQQVAALFQKQVSLLKLVTIEH
jgi:flagellar basal-body rod protein FlgB